ncbi:MAG: DEAD/DEAH box helicase [Armatimonadetes bacterium]|nr:DEAD/DEAH box helicase [Armatimonadota bacterium]MDW8154176.1 DEAD/DEAH box helicase [Armatimonadota bacterium]
MDLSFHPLVTRWFRERFPEPTPAQRLGWPAIAAGEDTLIAAPTGSGKTLAAFLWSLSGLLSSRLLPDQIQVVYVSPLRALSNDVHRNLHEPLQQIRELAGRLGVWVPEVRVAVRTGDTLPRERDRMIRRPPHILVTTPESLYLLLTAPRSREVLRGTRTVIVDELHAIAQDKRGAHLALSLERLDALTGRPCQRIGLSATAHPLETLARLLVGGARCGPDGSPRCAIVDAGWQRSWDLSIWLPGQVLGPVATHELWTEVYDRIAELAGQHRTTLVFVSTRRLAERVAHRLTERLGEGRVASHHGSLARTLRLETERRLKQGELSVVVATASLELGIDVGSVDLVCHVGAPRAISTLLQRVGRSGHGVNRVPKGVLFPLTRDELVQCAAAVWAVRRGVLDQVILPEKPLDVLAQQMVAIAASEPISEQDLFALVRRAYPYRDLSWREFQQVLEMLSEGIAARRGRAGALLHRDRVNGVVRARRGARMVALTCGGTIPETFDFDVIAEPDEAFIGRVNEDFAIESQAGDVFLLGNTSWRVRRVESSGRVRVENAHGAPPTIPFWLGEAPARTWELSQAVSDLRAEVAARIQDRARAVAWLAQETGLDAAGAEQLVDYVRETVAVLGCVPTQTCVVAERFFDEAGGMQIVLHAPFGARVNRAWGLALRKRFCLTFDFELQAAATDDGIVLSLGAQHSFPLELIFSFVRSQTVGKDLLQATLQSPLFGTRWRQNAQRALALLRQRGGRKVPPQIQRMQAEDLLAAVFPDQVGCQDNRMGPITPPDHPLVNETLRSCLQETMDLARLVEIVERMERGEIRTVAVETPQPSAMSHEILNANPYAFLDDAPLEERRARAVQLRRVDPDLARGPGALDPEAVAEVRAQVAPDVRDPDELHDLLHTLVLLPLEEADSWRGVAEALLCQGRATVAAMDRLRAYVAVERVPFVRAIWPQAHFLPEPQIPPDLPQPTREEAVLAVVRGWMPCLGPTTVPALAVRLGLPEGEVSAALAALEGVGIVLRGHYSPGVEEEEWCERTLLARIHRLTVDRLRREIEPVTPADFIRFLFRWQHVHPGTQLHGRGGLLEVIGQLQGLELPAEAWETSVLPARVSAYNPADLEALCLGGVIAWGRIVPNGGPESDRVRRRRGVVRTTPIAFLLREDLAVYVRPAEPCLIGLGGTARDALAYLEAHGASFLSDIARAIGRLPSEVEAALWELVAAGLVSGDGVGGLRQLLRRGRRRRGLRALPGGLYGRSLPVGRWALWRPTEEVPEPERTERIAQHLLRRYGVVFREVLARERAAPPWRDLVRVYRRWELQGRIRGGRFVSGFAGEQYALPEAVEALRAVRRTPGHPETVVVSAADPLNLVGILVPGERISPFSDLWIAFRNGVPVKSAPLGALLRLVQPPTAPTVGGTTAM